MSPPTKKKSRAAITLPEVVIAALILGILTGILFFLFRSGIVSLKKVENQSSLIRELQLISLKISEEVRQSTASSMSTSADGRVLAFLSAVDESSGEFQVDEFGRPEWQEYVVFYHEPSDLTIRRLKVDYSPVLRTDAIPLEEYSGGDLDDFIGTNNPAPVAHNISHCEWEAESSTLLRFEIESEKTRYQGTDKERKTITSRVYLRN